MKDTSPIDQRWIRDYCDEFLKAALLFPDGSPMHGAILRRVECVHDLVGAWQKRNEPKA